MKRQIVTMAVALLLLLLQPLSSHAQSISAEVEGLRGILEQLYNEMITMATNLVGVGRAIAGFGATLYIGYRVWGHIARAEPIDFYPLLRPFALGLVLTMYMPMIGLLNSILKPTVTATAGMVQNSDEAIKKLLEQRQEAVKNSQFWQMYVGGNGEGNFDQWYQYTHPDKDPRKQGMFEEIGNDMQFAMSKYLYQFKNNAKQWMSEILQVIFQAASLCIDTLRTFQLVILVILGPLVIGIAVFDGFQQSLTQWLARYINIFLWLPIANIFGALIGKIQEGMIRLDISKIKAQGDTFFSPTDTAYLIFMIVGIVGYFTVPSIANYVVHAHGAGSLTSKTNAVVMQAAKMV